MTKKARPESALYPKHHKAWDLEPYYSKHVGGMTEFELHDKADIAEQLAWRDKRIAELEAQLTELSHVDPEIRSAFGRVRTPGDGPKCRCGKPAVWGGYCQMADGRGYCSGR